MNNSELENIYHRSGSRHYDSNLRFLIEEVLHDLYLSNWPLLSYISLKHVDRAVYKYVKASKTKKIFHTKNYFTACIRSSIVELGIDELCIESDIY